MKTPARPRRRSTTQVRIIATEAQTARLREVLQMAAETIPGWRIADISRLRPCPPGRVRLYINLEIPNDRDA